MDPAEHWRRVEELFYAALDREEAARPAFLQQACGSNTELLKEVETLLSSADKPVDFLPNAVREMAQDVGRKCRRNACHWRSVGPL